jgi:hypothetical protein
MTNTNRLFSFFKALSIALVLLLNFSGCAKKVTPPPAPEFFEHTVKFSGESYSNIAAWYTGDIKNWKLIEAANPGLKPSKIKIGSVIKIPTNLINKFEPLPKKFLKGKNSASSVNKSETLKKEEQKENLKDTKSIENKVEPEPKVEPTEVTESQNPKVDIQPAPAEDEMVPAFEEEQSLVIEPTVVPAATLSPQEKAREDIIDEILSK